ncbi:CHAT domain-containing protein [Dactylosporangium matsuzakiense]|uniref:CHAT domain-containing protein n=1 Tax=Dactylosporangium matsuzakiense TaxID=53360 RepID=A0A9W6KQ38_9ACTN|nr:CHAT domain-containing protein [Dactylosporangium matsuzakiense]UWZ47468.1 CHAT domain-containing protein [Dactylosporangium matsuzakiense]GLL05223.1 hypothetical protein GCM10017581_069700 [Dactylosporangium matsuzakiense]
MARANHQDTAQRLAVEGNRRRDGGDLAGATAAWQEAFALDPANCFAEAGLALALAVRASTPEHLQQALLAAERAFARAMERKQAAEVATALNTRAEIRLRRGEFAVAVTDSQHCLGLGSAGSRGLQVSALRRIGIASGYLGQVAPAYDALRQAIAADPDDLDSRMALGRLAAERADHDTAIAEYSAAARLLSARRGQVQDADLTISSLLNDVGCAYTALDRLEEATAAFQSAHRHFPGNPYPIINAAFAAGRRGDRAELRRLLDAGLKAADQHDTHLTQAMLTEALTSHDGLDVLDALLDFGRITHRTHLQHKHGLQQRSELSAPTPISGPDPGTGAAVPKLRILLLSANPVGDPQLDIATEVRRIKEKVRLARDRDKLELLEHGAVRPGDLIPLLNECRPHIVHFSGHGNADGEILLAAEDGGSTPVGAAALGRLFRAMRDGIQVVVLNACWSAAQARAIGEHVDWVVAMRRPVTDDAAARFAAAFYQAFGYQLTVPEAFEQACAELALGGYPDPDVPLLLERDGAEPRLRFGR